MKHATEWVRTSDPVIRSPAHYIWTTSSAYNMGYGLWPVSCHGLWPVSCHGLWPVSVWCHGLWPVWCHGLWWPVSCHGLCHGLSCHGLWPVWCHGLWHVWCHGLWPVSCHGLWPVSCHGLCVVSWVVACVVSWVVSVYVCVVSCHGLWPVSCHGLWPVSCHGLWPVSCHGLWPVVACVVSWVVTCVVSWVVALCRVMGCGLCRVMGCGLCRVMGCDMCRCHEIVTCGVMGCGLCVSVTCCDEVVPQHLDRILFKHQIPSESQVLQKARFLSKHKNSYNMTTMLIMWTPIKRLNIQTNYRDDKLPVLNIWGWYTAARRCCNYNYMSGMENSACPVLLISTYIMILARSIRTVSKPLTVIGCRWSWWRLILQMIISFYNFHSTIFNN